MIQLKIDKISVNTNYCYIYTIYLYNLSVSLNCMCCINLHVTAFLADALNIVPIMNIQVHIWLYV